MGVNDTIEWFSEVLIGCVAQTPSVSWDPTILHILFYLQSCKNTTRRAGLLGYEQLDNLKSTFDNLEICCHASIEDTYDYFATIADIVRRLRVMAQN